MSNSNSNDTDYDNLIDYITTKNKTQLIIFIIFNSVIIIVSGLSINENNYKNLYLGIFMVFMFSLIYYIFIDSKYTKYKKAQNKKRKQKKKQNKDEADAKDAALLEENAICNVNPNLCMNGGKCKSVGSDLQQFQCNCTAGWKGNNCNTADGITINESDIDNRCSDPTTGQKKPDLEWCNANFDNKGGKCVSKDKYDIDCPINRDGSPNFKYNEYGCDVENDEVWCPETTSDNIGKCVIRASGNIGEPCNVASISQDCGGRRCLDWHNGKQTCVGNNKNEMVYNAKTDSCNIFECSKYNGDQLNCSNTFYCNYNEGAKKCNLKSNKENCQSKDNNRCEDDTNCIWDDRHLSCRDKKSGNSYGSDCIGYSKNKNICNNLDHCKYNNSLNLCMFDFAKENDPIKTHLGYSNDISLDFYKQPISGSCTDVDYILNGSNCEYNYNKTIVPANANRAAETAAAVAAGAAGAAGADAAAAGADAAAAGAGVDSFKVGGRIKGNGFKLNNGFVVGGLAEI
jgi:hypothetical protein